MMEITWIVIHNIKQMRELDNLIKAIKELTLVIQLKTREL